MENKQNNLETIRHSFSHVLAAAVKDLYPDVKFAIGPAIDNGFYYDFDFGDNSPKEENLKAIEKKMNHLIKQNVKFEKSELSTAEAIKKAKKEKQPYKLELIEDLKKEGDTSTGSAQEIEVSFYKLGNFEDLCAGPHVEATNKLNKDAFKLDRIAGAYWKGSEENDMLTRIYGLAFETKEKLDAYIKMMKLAKERDHRKIGKEQELFLIDPMVGLGLAMWQPKGAMLWRIMEDFWHSEHLKNGYELVRTPHIGSRKLWETSGHWNFYNDSMYPPIEIGQSLEESQKGKKSKVKEEYLLKPMNCPFHVMLYKSRPRSYRELPIRWAECGTVYRYEKSGELSGLTRVRGFTQDDAHIICTQEQAEEELKKVLDFIIFIFKSFGFTEYKTYLSVKDPKGTKYSGTDEGWDFTEKVLEKVARDKNLEIEKDVGGAVFYGPKLDFKVKDAIGREWQCSTLQYDFNLPEKFDMTYIDKDGKEKRPYMLHRALFGSFERFIGLLIEHYEGAFPTWLSPVQVKIISVGEDHIEYCQKLADELKKENIRIELDINNETVSNKIRKATSEKAPFMLVIGDKEMEGGNLAVRRRGSRDTEEISKENLIKEIADAKPGI